MSLRQQAVRGVVWSAVQNWGSLAIGTLAFLVLARLLEPADFGVFAMASVFTALMDVLLRQGFSQAIVQRGDIEPEHLDTAFWFSAVVGVVLMLVGWALADWMATLFKVPQLAGVVWWVSISFVLGGLCTTHQAILQRRMAFKRLAIRSLLSTSAGAAVGITMAVMGYGVWSLVGQFLAAAVVGGAVLWWAAWWRPGLGVGRRHFADMFSFGANVLGSAILGVVSRRADALLIGYFLGAELLGYYNVAQRLLMALTQAITQSVTAVAFPTFSRLQDKPEQMLSAYYTAIRMTSLVAFPAFLGMAAIAGDLIPLALGSRWTPSVPVVQVLAIIGILHSVTFFNGSVLLAMGKPSWRFGVMMVNTIANIVAYLLVIRLGIVAVAAAFVIRGYVLTPLTIWVVRKLIPLDPMKYLRQFAAPLLGSMIMVVAVVAVSYALSGTVALPLALVIDIVVGGLVYVGAIRIIAPSLSREAFGLVRVALPRKRHSLNPIDSDP